MAIESREKVLGGISFEVTQLPYFAAQRLFTRLLKLAGPALLGLAQVAGVAGGKASLAMLAQREVSELVPVLAAFFERLDPNEAEGLTREILRTTRARHNGTLVDLVGVMDAVIGGDFWTGLAVQAFALTVHFGNFNSARGALSALGLKVSPSEGSTTSTGSTGGA